MMMVNKNLATKRFSSLTRLTVLVLFVFTFLFATNNHALAQTQDLCPEVPLGPNGDHTQKDACNACRDHGTVEQPQCKHWIDSWGTPYAAPQEVVTYVPAVAAAHGINTCVSKAPAANSMMVKMNKEGFDNLTIGNLLADPVCRIGGCGCTLNGLVFVGPPPNSDQLAYYQGGVMSTLTNATSSIAIIPVSTADYISDLRNSLQNPLGAQPAYAQGLGFSSLRPVLGLWKLFRNIAYFFFVIIFIVIGFLIMFRSKIGGQAAITIQQALPKIIVALLLVTFSYAIAGLMIDLMYLLIYLMIGIFSANGTPGLDGPALTKVAFTNHIFENIFELIASPSNGVVGTIGSSIGSAVTHMLTDSGWGDATGAFAGLGASIIFSLVMLVALLVNMFRIFFALLQAYVMVIFSVVFAPIQLLLGALPGQNTFTAWLKGLWKNLLAFPVVIFFLLCAHYFTATNFGVDTQGGFAAPQLGLQAGGGAQSGRFILAIMQFGILALIPKAIEIAGDLVNGKLSIDPGKAMGEFYKQGAVGKAIGIAGIGAGVGIAGGAIAGGVNALRAPSGQRMATFKRDLGRGTLVGAGAGVVTGGGLSIAQKGLSTVGKFQRDIKSVQELREGYKEGRAADKERTSAAQESAGSTSGGTTPFSNPNDPTR